MLVQSIRNRLYLQSVKSPEVLQDDRTIVTARAAPKITSQDKLIDWNAWTAEMVIRRHHVIGPLWSFVKHAQKVRRLIWTTGFTITEKVAPKPDLPVGQLVAIGDENCADEQLAYVRTCDNRVLKVDKIKIEGGVESPPFHAARKADMIDHGTLGQSASKIELLLSTDSLVGK